MRWKNIPAQILICETSREVSEQKTPGAQVPLPLNVPQWHIDYFELKLLREDPIQESSQVTLVVKNPPANSGDIKDAGSIPGLGRSPGGGHSNPFQYSCLENPISRGAWWPTGLQRVRQDWSDVAQCKRDNLTPLSLPEAGNNSVMWKVHSLHLEVEGHSYH